MLVCMCFPVHFHTQPARGRMAPSFGMYMPGPQRSHVSVSSQQIMQEYNKINESQNQGMTPVQVNKSVFLLKEHTLLIFRFSENLGYERKPL